VKLFRILIVTGSLCSFASAGTITQADYNETLDLPISSSGARVEQLNAVSLPAASPQLTAANIISNPSNWNNSLNVSFDPTTNILSLTGDGNNDYQIITVMLSNLVFSSPNQIVIGITPISVGNAVFADASDTDPTLSTTTFYGNGLFGVQYQAANITTTNNDFLIRAQTDTFQVQLGVIPEPGTLGLIAVGAAVMLGWRRKAA
jgi:hypothetical protein